MGVLGMVGEGLMGDGHNGHIRHIRHNIVGLMGACPITIGITGLLGGLLIMPIASGRGALFSWLVEQVHEFHGVSFEFVHHFLHAA